MTQNGYPEFQVEEIDPVFAKELLGSNTHNRTLRHRRIEELATDMREGSWQQNGESIKIARDGTIIDGQHRLHAIIAADVTLPILVVRDLPMSTQEVVDTGSKRTFPDVLKLRKESNSVTLAAVTRRVETWTRGIRTIRAAYVATNTQLLQTLDRYPDIRIAAEAAESVRTHIRLQASSAGLCYWVFSNLATKDQEEADRLSEDLTFFYERLKDGAELATDHPIYVLRRTIIDNMNSKTRLNENTSVAYVIKAWNAYREGRTMKYLRYRPGGANPEIFPEPK